MSRASSIPASSLSAMIWGGRGWHVILRAGRYTLLLYSSLDCSIHSQEGRIVAKKRKKSRRITLLYLAPFCQPGGRDAFRQNANPAGGGGVQ